MERAEEMRRRRQEAILLYGNPSSLTNSGLLGSSGFRRWKPEPPPHPPPPPDPDVIAALSMPAPGQPGDLPAEPPPAYSPPENPRRLSRISDVATADEISEAPPTPPLTSRSTATQTATSSQPESIPQYDAGTYVLVDRVSHSDDDDNPRTTTYELNDMLPRRHPSAHLRPSAPFFVPFS